MPDKAIDLLDEACTCANLRNKAISDYELFLKKRDELKSEEEELTSKAETTTEDAERDKVYKDLATVKTELLSYDGKEDELKEKASHNDVKEEDLAKVINLWTGIPVTKVMEGDIKRLAGLEDRLKAHLIGQDEAVDLVVAAIKRNRVQLSVQRRPASFVLSVLPVSERPNLLSCSRKNFLTRLKLLSGLICQSLWKSIPYQDLSDLLRDMWDTTRQVS